MGFLELHGAHDDECTGLRNQASPDLPGFGEARRRGHALYPGRAFLSVLQNVSRYSLSNDMFGRVGLGDFQCRSLPEES